jgi:hypothetical protein
LNAQNNQDDCSRHKSFELKFVKKQQFVKIVKEKKQNQPE